jgi:hypothetical protein
MHDDRAQQTETTQRGLNVRRDDPFFSKKTCDRCPNPLPVRKLSWFNGDTICMECAAKEDTIKEALRAKGIEGALEGCGYIPNPEKVGV